MVEQHIIGRVAALLSVPAGSLQASLGPPPDPSLGEYALGCFGLAKTLRKKPAEVASDIAARFGATELVREARAAGPYVNFRVHPEAYLSWILGSVHEAGEKVGRSALGAGQTVIIEFSSPNIAKPLNVHHLRPTMIGNALCNLFRALGYKVIAINHLGDWGTQFGQLMAAVERYGSPDTLKGDPLAQLSSLYVRFHEEAEKDPTLLEEGRKWFRRLEQADARAVELWSQLREISLAEFQRTYDLLGVKFDSYMGESAYATMMGDTLRRLEEKGLTQLSEGATIVDLTGYGLPPCLLLKSDGATIYATRELAAAEYRHRAYHFARMVYVVGSDQRLHFRQVFKVLELMGYEWAKNCVHVDFGLMRFKQAKMSSRRGTGIPLDDLVQEAIRRVRSLIAEKNPELPDKETVARQIGIGAVVFANLKSRRVKDVDFDWEEALSFEGETGPYLQYTHARLCSILRKYGKSVQKHVDFGMLREPEELQLGRKLAQYGQALTTATETYEPCVLAGYLLDLASGVNTYYHRHRVILEQEDLAAARVLLVDCARQVIANGLAVLGIAPVAEM